MSDTFNSIEEAVEDIKNGKPIIVVDDENRENEGDLVAAAELTTPELINFMVTHGRGLVCVPLNEKKAQKLKLPLMVGVNTDPLKTAFTVSVDLLGNGCTTGISASDRAKTVNALANPNSEPTDFNRPGHIFPLIAKNGGVLKRTGHTEAAVDLAQLAGLEPTGVIVEIMNEDGSMARLPQLFKIAEKFSLKIVSIEDLIAYRLSMNSLIQKTASKKIDASWGSFDIHIFEENMGLNTHIALSFGKIDKDIPVPVKVQTINSLSYLNRIISDKEDESLKILKNFSSQKNGILVLIFKKSKAFELKNLISQFESKEEKLSSIDRKEIGIGAQILKNLGAEKIQLISNQKHVHSNLVGYGIQIVDIIKPTL